MSRLLFKEHEYSFKALLELSNKSHMYKEGEVIDIDTGQIFRLEHIQNVMDNYSEELMDSTYKKNVTKKLNDSKKIIIYKDRFNNDVISMTELEELISLISKTEYNKEPFNMRYFKFVKVNIGEELPIELKDNDVGKFYRMLYFLCRTDNVLKTTDRKNGKPIFQKDLMKYLNFKTNEVYRRFIRKLIKNNLIRELKNSSNNKIIILNPIYVNKDIRVDYTTYVCFKKDLDKYLSKYEIKYLEMLGTSDSLISSYEIIS